jgi:SAM-dependent methyltransferase
MVHQALETARTVLNVGAGAGSYEPEDRYVLALEPSAAMRAQRPVHIAPAISGTAENIPLDDQSIDASMAMITLHQWSDLARGLREMCRVTRGPIVILTFDRDAFERFWLAKYVPELIAAEYRRFPSIETIRAHLRGTVDVRPIAIPSDCLDGFIEAFYARPERLLEADVRGAQSAWGFVDTRVQKRFVKTLGEDLRSGQWDRQYGAWRQKPSFEGSLRLIVSNPDERAAS